MKRINRIGLVIMLCDIAVAITRPVFTGPALTVSDTGVYFGLIVGGFLLMVD
jgi:hypothetical protein